MATTKRDAEMSSSACNAGSRLVRGEGVRSAHGIPPQRYGWKLSKEKLFLDSDCTGLRRLSGTSRRWVVVSWLGRAKAASCKAAFSSRKEVLVIRKEASCCW